MLERYDHSAATHYAAYRPPLHLLILQRVFSESTAFDAGLDVGCGTGYSAVALATYSAHVHGIDPSLAMLRRATHHPKVSYYGGAAEAIPLPDNSVDVVTFAGSLSYIDRAACGAELRRVCRGAALVVAYDFEIRLDEVLRYFGIALLERRSAYDHQANLSGNPGFAKPEVGSDRIRLQPTARELAHLVLSDSHRFDRFAQYFGVADPFPPLLKDLEQGKADGGLDADIYYAKHEFRRSA